MVVVDTELDTYKLFHPKKNFLLLLPEGILLRKAGLGILLRKVELFFP